MQQDEEIKGLREEKEREASLLELQRRECDRLKSKLEIVESDKAQILDMKRSQEQTQQDMLAFCHDCEQKVVELEARIGSLNTRLFEYTELLQLSATENTILKSRLYLSQLEVQGLLKKLHTADSDKIELLKQLQAIESEKGNTV